MESGCMINVNSMIWCSRYCDDIMELNGDVIDLDLLKYSLVLLLN